jgi:hypothetical protein
VGAYIDSRDLKPGPRTTKMMITPAVRFPRQQAFRPFAQPGIALVQSLELQVPFANDLNQKGSFTYVVADFEFEDRHSHDEITYKTMLFRHNSSIGLQPSPEYLQKSEVGAFDVPSHSYIIGNPLVPDSRVVTPLADSTLFQIQTWKGWRLFHSAITRDNFATALQSLKQRAPTFGASVDPADYILQGWHLNAEILCGSAPSQLGWSMRKARVTLVPESQVLVQAKN